MLELLYLSVAVLTVYVGLLYLRRAGPAQRTYAWLLLADGGLAGFAYLACKGEAPEAFGEPAGAVALFGFVGLVLLPPILKAVTRRAIASENERLALWLTTVREILTPGLGARQEREMIAASRAVRLGHGDEVLAALRQQRTLARDPREREIIDDRLVLVLLGVERWREAIDTFQDRTYEHIRGGQVPLFVDVVHAHLEIGDLAGAANLLAFLEGLAGANEPVVAPQLARARLMFLAFAGRVASVENLMTLQKRALAADTRAYWLGVARQFAGDSAGAQASLAVAARKGTDRRRRAAAAERLDALRTGAQARELSHDMTVFADGVSARAVAAIAEAPPVLEGLHISATPVTMALIAANLAAFAAVSIVFGTTTDTFALFRSGANFHDAVEAGEWWRLISCTFLHVGALHIGANMLSLWSLGRVVEQIVGSVRFGAIYALAGISGSLASYLFSPSLSAGASGAVFGILGAAIVEFALRRTKKRSAWRASLLQQLVFIAAVQLAIGFTSSLIDQSAHLGGLVGGALGALILSARHRFGRGVVGAGLALLLCAAGVAVTAWTVRQVVETSYAETVDRIGWHVMKPAGVLVEVPRNWKKPTHEAQEESGAVKQDAAAGDQGDEDKANEASVVEPDGIVNVSFNVRDASDLGAVMTVIRAQDEKQSAVKSVEDVASPFAAPSGWSARALRLRAEASSGEELGYLEVVFMRTVGERLIVIDTVVTERAVTEAGPVIERMVGSAHLPP